MGILFIKANIVYTYRLKKTKGFSMLPRLLLLFAFSFFSFNLQARPELTKVEQKISDTVITTKINAKLARHGERLPLKLHISTSHGVVAVEGAVPDRKTFVDVLRRIKTTRGVVRINASRLSIKKVNTPLTDAYITAKAEAAVLKAKVFDDESIPLVGINAQTKDGVVNLSGFVKKSSSIPLITHRVAKIKGVKHVRSSIRVVNNG